LRGLFRKRNLERVSRRSTLQHRLRIRRLSKQTELLNMLHGYLALKEVSFLNSTLWFIVRKARRTP
jgi:hypothetical protein